MQIEINCRHCQILKQMQRNDVKNKKKRIYKESDSYFQMYSNLLLPDWHCPLVFCTL